MSKHWTYLGQDYVLVDAQGRVCGVLKSYFDPELIRDNETGLRNDSRTSEKKQKEMNEHENQ